MASATTRSGPICCGWPRTAPDTDPRLALDPDDVVLALFTSGTTGTLKAVQHTHRSYCAVVHNVLTNLIDPKPGEIMLHAASLIHASGCFVLPYWLRGGTAAILPGFTPSSYLEAIERFRPQALSVVPTMLQMLFQTPGIDTGRPLLGRDDHLRRPRPCRGRCWRRGWRSGGRSSSNITGRPRRRSPSAAWTRRRMPARRRRACSSCGRPSVETEIRLVDEEGRDVPTGEPGEILLRAPFVMKGYTDAALTAETMLPGGWLRTRDIGRFDDEGYLTLVDRTSDMIVTGGYNVYPREVEDVLGGARQRGAGRGGRPARRQMGRDWSPPSSCLHAGAAADEAALIAHAHDHLAGYKAPKSVRFVEAIPLSPVGKPLRRALREPFWAGRERRI